MNESFTYSRPMLIFDDTCSSCEKFARLANSASRRWIRIAGHYYSDEALITKKLIFPKDYESTRMFWIITSRGAYGGRAGLLPLIKEIIVGFFIHNEYKHDSRDNTGINKNIRTVPCNLKPPSCESTKGIISRLFGLLRTSATMPIDKWK